MKFIHLIQHLERIAALKAEVLELRAKYPDLAPPDVALYIQELEKTMNVYLNCDVEQPS